MEHRVSATVGASPAVVYGLFIDIERWPELSASTRSVRRLDSGPLRVGSEAILKQPRLPSARWRVTEMEPGRSFVWETRSGGVTRELEGFRSAADAAAPPVPPAASVG